MVMFGGEGSGLGGEQQGCVYVLDANTLTWTCQTVFGEDPGPRSLHLTTVRSLSISTISEGHQQPRFWLSCACNSVLALLQKCAILGNILSCCSFAMAALPWRDHAAADRSSSVLPYR